MVTAKPTSKPTPSVTPNIDQNICDPLSNFDFSCYGRVHESSLHINPSFQALFYACMVFYAPINCLASTNRSCPPYFGIRQLGREAITYEFLAVFVKLLKTSDPVLYSITL